MLVELTTLVTIRQMLSRGCSDQGISARTGLCQAGVRAIASQAYPDLLRGRDAVISRVIADAIARRIHYTTIAAELGLCGESVRRKMRKKEAAK